MKKSVILDVDTGIDDAVAIALATYSNKLKVDVYGVPHVMGYGGTHSAIPKYRGEGFFVMSDIALT